MSIQISKWFESAVLTPASLLSGAQASGILDLRQYAGARLWLGVCKNGSVQPSTAINVSVRPQYSPATKYAGGRLLPSVFEVNAEKAATIVSTVVSAATWVNSGVAAVRTKALGTLAPQYMVGIAPANLARFEVAKLLHKRPAGTASQLTFRSTLQFAHSGNQDNIFWPAEQWVTYLPGGAQYRILFVHQGTAGSPQIVNAFAQIAAGTQEVSR